MSLDNLTGRASRASRATQTARPGGLVSATIATTPAGSEPVDVLIGGDATQRTGPCSWTPVVRDGELFTPARDDPCVVASVQRGGEVVVWWEPGDDREGTPVAPVPSTMTVGGTIAADGSIITGTGFTAARPGTGIYNITFSPVFSAPPYAVVPAGGPTGGVIAILKVNTTPTASSTQIVALTTAGTLQDSIVEFIAFGPV